VRLRRAGQRRPRVRKRARGDKPRRLRRRAVELDAERRRQLTGNGVASRALDAVEAKLIAGVLGNVPASRRDAQEFLSLYGAREGARS